MTSNKACMAVCLLILSMPTSLVSAATILASDFNKLYSCENPFIATETTTIELNEDIAINGVCELIKAGTGFDTKNDKIIFTSDTSNRVVIAQDSTWQLGLTTQFAGNARLEKESAGKVHLMNTTLTMSGHSKYITIPVT